MFLSCTSKALAAFSSSKNPLTDAEAKRFIAMIEKAAANDLVSRAEVLSNFFIDFSAAFKPLGSKREMALTYRFDAITRPT